jgi:hypothetical protein
MSQIIKTKFLCKSGCRVSSGLGYGLNKKGHKQLSYQNYWTDLFIKGKWYDGEYQTWNWEDGYRCNGGWRKYWVVNEKGIKEEVNRIKMSTIFQLDIEELRDNKIEEILKK